MMFLCLLSYDVLFVKPSLLEINEKIDYLNENITSLVPKTLPTQSWSILQTIINIWVFMFAIEEFRQVKKTKAFFFLIQLIFIL